jgi:hypothetical protein
MTLLSKLDSSHRIFSPANLFFDCGQKTATWMSKHVFWKVCYVGSGVTIGRKQRKTGFIYFRSMYTSSTSPLRDLNMLFDSKQTRPRCGHLTCFWSSTDARVIAHRLLHLPNTLPIFEFNLARLSKIITFYKPLTKAY